MSDLSVSISPFRSVTLSSNKHFLKKKLLTAPCTCVYCTRCELCPHRAAISPDPAPDGMHLLSQTPLFSCVLGVDIHGELRSQDTSPATTTPAWQHERQAQLRAGVWAAGVCWRPPETLHQRLVLEEKLPVFSRLAPRPM